MSNRKSNIISQSYIPPANRSMHLNPAATNYAPAIQSQNKLSSQVSAPPSPYLEARVLNLEQEHGSLRENVSNLTEIYHDLCSSVDKLKKGGWPVTVGPFQDQDAAQSHICAMQFKQELEELNHEVRKSVEDVTDVEKVNGTKSPVTHSDMSSQLGASSGAGTGSKSLPPHLRGKAMSG
jgi:hypothetical protein